MNDPLGAASVANGNPCPWVIFISGILCLLIETAYKTNFDAVVKLKTRIYPLLLDIKVSHCDSNHCDASVGRQRSP